MIEIDIRTNKPKIKLYRESDGKQLKGDGLCTYMKYESVDLATNILDGSNPYPEIQKSSVITVQRAKFEMKGDKYDPKLKPKGLGKKEKARLEKKREKLLPLLKKNKTILYLLFITQSLAPLNNI